MNAPAKKIPTVSFLIAETIGREMERDPSILVLGEDVGGLGGVFNCTRGLQEQFGEWRVRDTPIAEMGFVGMGVGLAMSGYRPVVEIMFADFLGVCLEQIVNAAAKIPYMSGGRVTMPLVIRTAAGSIGSAAQHSQCLWGMMAYWPGLKVVAPSCPADYRGLTASALRSEDPVVIFEHKSQLNRKSDLFARPDIGPQPEHLVPIGKASLARDGTDVTIVTISAAVEWALNAAESVAGEGIDAAVVDLRSLVPMDMETVTSSLAKTGRLLVVDEDFRSFAMSGEVVARAVEAMGPGALRQVRRLCMPDVPLPAAKSLEDAVMPGPEKIAATLRDMAEGA
ncbi:MAG: alpha-ketoacid dehydrogenase subunit beta [Bauldia sp.]|uniref:alpha-ketoacid dehydrogenase subunit beta n=2 Tax=Bauldia sp. TaxID=2575872 RepID=UPI001D4D6BF8|nr:transketolase C-terminal domain-containing protein [Bauldia sp.]MCB1495363.1 alpha-ketoacid dehydrogenase subunit beta [Bauldia sp.]